MLSKLVIRTSLAAGICLPFHFPYTRSRQLDPHKSMTVKPERQYPAIGPFFHLY